MLPSPLDRWRDAALIDHLARVRAPWEALVRRVVRATLAKFLPPSPAPVVEIGAGGGALRAWLPPDLAARTTHTEPSEPLLEGLRARYPDARAVRAEASALPFAGGEVGAVLALCVFDTVPDLAPVRDELARVLRPGGAVVHFLDLATSPDCLFPELIAGGELPLTNFARDTGLIEVLTDAQRALLPAADEFDEVLAVQWEAFARFVGMLEPARHPLTADLGPYAGLTRPGALDPDALARGVMAASADPVRLRALNAALLKLMLSAKQMGREWPLRAVSARAHVRARLRAAFGPAHGFEPEFAGPVSAVEVGEATGFVVRHAGRTVNRASAPPSRHGTPVEELEGAPREHGARETTVEVFVARRV